MRSSGTALLHVLALAACLGLTSAKSDKDAIDAALAWAKKQQKTFVKDLEALVAIPSVSASRQHTGDVVKAANWLAKRLKKAGLQNVQLLYAPNDGNLGHPAVYGEWVGPEPEAPSVLVYGHADVQPAEPLQLWHTPPFKMTVKDGDAFGRGVEDCKGTLLQAVQAVEAVLAANAALPVNVKFLLEGQEEIGSPDLIPLLEANKQLLKADVVLSADGGQKSKTQGSVSLGLRGAVALEVVLKALDRDVHSGLLGGAVINPALALSRLLATLHKEDGSIAVEGYYDDVRPMSEQDTADAAAFGWEEEQELASIGAVAHGEAGYTALERTWYRPSLDVVGMFSGHTGEGSKTIIPATATAKLSSRIVPNQDPAKCADLITAHLKKHAPPGVDVTVTPMGFSAAPYDAPRDSLGNRAAAAVLEKVLASKPLFERSGGTIPAMAQFKRVLGTDAAMFAFGLPGSNIHAPNEHYPLDFFHKGREAWVHMLFEVATLYQQENGSAAPAAAAGQAGDGRDEL